jgi:hypothetical protein
VELGWSGAHPPQTRRQGRSAGFPQRVVLDIDSTEVPVYGQQENSAYNGHFESTCCHPLLLFNRDGDWLAAKLRPGNVHSAEGWKEMLLPEIERQQKQGKQVVFRADATFAKPEIYEALEQRDLKCAIRILSYDSLERDIAELLTRPGPGGAPRDRATSPWCATRASCTRQRFDEGPADGGQG